MSDHQLMVVSGFLAFVSVVIVAFIGASLAILTGR